MRASRVLRHRHAWRSALSVPAGVSSRRLSHCGLRTQNAQIGQTEESAQNQPARFGIRENRITVWIGSYASTWKIDAKEGLENAIRTLGQKGRGGHIGSRARDDCESVVDHGAMNTATIGLRWACRTSQNSSVQRHGHRDHRNRGSSPRSTSRLHQSVERRPSPDVFAMIPCSPR